VHLGFVEEVIAESYDDPNADTQQSSANNPEILATVGHVGCPNKFNVYHTCSNYCITKWGKGKQQPSMRYHTVRLRMLTKYPLPSSWLEVYDPGS